MQVPDRRVRTGIEFLMLYDTVPGGTGYLKQMMNDPENVLRILRMARDALVQCRVQRRPIEGRLLSLRVRLPA